MTKARTGRPPGTGLDDNATLDRIENLLVADPDLSMRAAIIRVVGDADATIRRLQRKLNGRQEERLRPAQAFGAVRFDVEPCRELPSGSAGVSMLVGDDQEFVLEHYARYERPYLRLLSSGREIHWLEDWSHPLAADFNRLPFEYGWDHPGYRRICARTGIDPDLGRQHTYRTCLDGIAAYEALLTKAGRAGELDHFFEHEARMRSDPQRDPLWELVEDGSAFPRYEWMHFEPMKLAELYGKHVGLDDPRSNRAAADALHAFERVDWSLVFVDSAVVALPTPFSKARVIEVSLNDEREQEPRQLRGGPIVAAMPGPTDLVHRRALLSAERKTMTVVLSPEEQDAFERGGDADYWRRYHAGEFRGTRALRALFVPTDLAMTRRIAIELVRVSYEGYLARSAGSPLGAASKLSCETRDPIQGSGSRTFRENVRATIRAVDEPASWHGLAGPRKPPFRSSSRIHFPRGSCLATDDYNRILIRTTGDPVEFEGRKMRLSVDLVPWGPDDFIPDLSDPSFELTDADSGRPLDCELALSVLKSVSGAVADHQRDETFDRIGRNLRSCCLCVAVIGLMALARLF